MQGTGAAVHVTQQVTEQVVAEVVQQVQSGFAREQQQQQDQQVQHRAGRHPEIRGGVRQHKQMVQLGKVRCLQHRLFRGRLEVGPGCTISEEAARARR